MTCKLERQMGIGGSASGSSPDKHHDGRCHGDDCCCHGDDHDDHGDDDHGDDDRDGDDDKPLLRPLQSVGLCNLNSPAQEPVSPADKGAAIV